MKKQRPHKARQNAQHKARKAAAKAPAPRQHEALPAADASPAAQAHIEPRARRTAPAAGDRHQRPGRDSRRNETPRSGGRRSRAKGPPPTPVTSLRAPRPVVASSAPRARDRGNYGTTKLSPALLALLAQSDEPQIELKPVRSSVWARAAANEWRADRAAVLILLLPTLLTALLLMVLPHTARRPDAPDLIARNSLPARSSDQDAALLSERQPSTTADTVALGEPALPPFMRTPEAVAPVVPLAVHDLGVAVAALSRDTDAARRPFNRPSEILSPVIEDSAVTAHVSVPLAAPAPALTDNDLATASEQARIADSSCRAMPGSSGLRPARQTAQLSLPPLLPDAALSGDPERFGLALAHAAKAQTTDLVIYNAHYMAMSYPRGDVPSMFGVCTDVVIRAYRALNIDLQELVHLSRLGPSDPNIDHRRTELLRRFLATHGEQLSTSPYVEDYLPGDIVTYYRPQNRSSTAHIAVVTDEIAPSGRPLIAHNRGWGVQLEDALFVDQMTGHYRFRGMTPSAVAALPRSVALAAAQPKRGDPRVASAIVAAASSGVRGTNEAPSAPLLVEGTAPAKMLKPPMALGAAPSTTAVAGRCAAASGQAAGNGHCRPARAL